MDNIDNFYDAVTAYNEMLDGAYGTVSIAGYEHDTSRVLREIDPIAYRCGFADWLDWENLSDDADTWTDSENYPS